MSEITGKQIAQTAKQMFGTDQITQEQLAYVIDMLRPSSYLLRNHTIRNHPMTFVIQDRDTEKALAHRPWQIQILNDSHKDIAIIKSRQLGLSELGIGKLLHFVDTHSYDAVKALYTFPKLCGD